MGESDILKSEKTYNLKNDLPAEIGYATASSRCHLGCYIRDLASDDNFPDIELGSRQLQLTEVYLIPCKSIADVTSS